MEKQVIKVRATLTESMLGTVPKSKDVYAKYIATKAPVMDPAEVLTVQETEEKGWTGFHQDEKGIFVYDYFIRGFLKSAAQAMREQVAVKNYKSKIDQYVFVMPRKVYVLQDGKHVKTPDGVVERPLRAMTMQGPRVTLARSDFLNAGSTMEFDIHLLKNKDISEDTLKSWFEYAQYQGFGQFRNGSYGRATIETLE